MKHVIDTTIEEFKNVPKSLNGEVLLERTKDSNGKFDGYLTITVDKLMTIKAKTDIELEQIGWMKYKHILDSF